MKSIMRYLLCAAIAALITVPVMTGCKDTNSFDKSKIMLLEFGEPNNPEIPGPPTQDVPKTGVNGIHPIFQGTMGIPISALSIGAIDPDPTGHTICDDFDGDGIPNPGNPRINPGS